MWFCSNCLTAFPGVRNIMIKMGSLEDKYEKLEKRVDSLEKQPSTVENVQEVVRDEINEIRDIESRRLQLICFNMPESESMDPTERKTEDESKLKSLIDDDMKLRDKGIEIESPVRLGKIRNEELEVDSQQQNRKSVNRPLRFKVTKFEDKRQILMGNSELKNSKNDNVNKIFLTPDLTKKQREDSFKLREELRYRKFVQNEKNIKISRGRIVSINNPNSSSPANVPSSSGARFNGSRVFNSRALSGSGGVLAGAGRPALRPFRGEQ